MKLYSRQLHSLEELKREKHVLKYAKKHTDDWLSFKDMDNGKANAEDAAGAGLLGSLLSAVGSKSILSAVLAMAPPILTLMSKNSSSGRKRTNPLERLAKDVVVGYIKWKVLQFAYRSVIGVAKSNKEKNTKR
ncbi:MAG TPA: hypothetical protein PL009_07410 [Flavipsychrobacter sp.]|nr:hypothetical protein [Flavipsychrobacter sp.]